MGERTKRQKAKEWEKAGRQRHKKRTWKNDKNPWIKREHLNTPLESTTVTQSNYRVRATLISTLLQDLPHTHVDLWTVWRWLMTIGRWEPLHGCSPSGRTYVPWKKGELDLYKVFSSYWRIHQNVSLPVQELKQSSANTKMEIWRHIEQVPCVHRNKSLWGCTGPAGGGVDSTFTKRERVAGTEKQLESESEAVLGDSEASFPNITNFSDHKIHVMELLWQDYQFRTVIVLC